MRNKPTRKQKKLVKAIVEDPTATLEELGRRAGYSDRQHTHRALKSEAVQGELAKCREMMDADDRLQLKPLLNHLAEGLEATEVRSLKVDGSKLRVSAEVKDFDARFKYLDKALELRGLTKQRGDEAPSGPVNVAIVLMGGGSEAEKAAVADALLAARISRGLHPIENRALTEDEAATYRRTK